MQLTPAPQSSLFFFYLGVQLGLNKETNKNKKVGTSHKKASYLNTTYDVRNLISGIYH